MDNYHCYTIYKAANQRRIAFFLPSGFTKSRQYFIVIRRLRKMGVTVVAIDIDWDGAIRDLTPQGYGRLAKSVTETVNTVSENLNASSITLLGASAGSFFSMQIARSLDTVSGVVLFQPWGSMSHLFWRYAKLATQKNRWIAQGVENELHLEKLVETITPSYDLGSLANLPMIVFTSTGDRVVTDSNQMQEILKSKLKNATFYQSRLGHLFGIIFSMLSLRKWKKIFDL